MPRTWPKSLPVLFDAGNWWPNAVGMSIHLPTPCRLAM